MNHQKKGVYIVANDRVIEQAIALLNSIRFLRSRYSRSDDSF